ncbi:MAG TPA: PHP-associated domain-containing protein [Ktedonobacteraceae bacterium]|nr:PHP-associated domain-containing protein [Ktedonobacteraceae bacterium]
MIENTYSTVISTVDKPSAEKELVHNNNQASNLQIPLTAKLSRADLHIHSTYSDGMPTIEQILQYTQLHTDLDVIAITDHNVIDGSLRARDLWAKSSYRFDYIVGEEVSTNEGHLLALFIEKHIPSHLSIERTIDLVHDQDGLAIVVHPLHPLMRMSCQRSVLNRLHANRDIWPDGIETWNAGLCGIFANRITMRANRKRYGWPEVGNSDAHTLHAIGRACTFFEGSTAYDFRTALQSGLSTSGGKLWTMNDFFIVAGFQMQKRRLAHRQSAA